jgi:ribosomal protein L1
MEHNFKKLFTTPSHIVKLKALGKLLGPKGLMPNAKLGTLVPL